MQQDVRSSRTCTNKFDTSLRSTMNASLLLRAFCTFNCSCACAAATYFL